MKSNYLFLTGLSFRRISASIVLDKIKNKEKFTKDDYKVIDILLRDYIKRIDEIVNKR